MIEPTSHPVTPTTTGTPRWVKVFGVVALLVVLLFVALLLLDGGKHGPGRHAPSDDPDVTGHTASEGGHG